MKICICELEKGDGTRKPAQEDILKLLFGGVQTAFIHPKNIQVADLL